jgi:hypothetical protein
MTSSGKWWPSCQTRTLPMRVSLPSLSVSQAFFSHFFARVDGIGQKQAGRGKIEGCFQAGYGTVVFFEDQEVVKSWGEKMPAFEEVCLTLLHLLYVLLTTCRDSRYGLRMLQRCFNTLCGQHYA